MANVSVDWGSLYPNHPSYQNIWNLIDDIPSYVNETCAVQLSYALNRSGTWGVIGQQYNYPSSMVYTGRVRAFQSDDGYNYIYSVIDMKVYLDNTYGTADNYTGAYNAMQGGISGRTGILAFGYRHIDLWDGNNIHRPSDYSVNFWADNSVRNNGIFFWEVTSQYGF
jgi:hypothetical protein